MKSYRILAILPALAAVMLGSCTRAPRPTWAEEFNTGCIDTTVWSKIPRGGGGWWLYMSPYDGCYEMRDGCLILKGMVNPGIEGDDAPYLQGGLWTKRKKTFGYGRLEIRAKIGEAQGSWPALWMMPECWQDVNTHPLTEAEKYWAEIDICEKLNSDDFAYQTLHTNNDAADNAVGRVHGGKGNIHRNDFNVYAVEHYRDSIKLFVNDSCTLCYRCNPEMGKKQWNFDQKYELFVDMQLGGSLWPGEVNPDDLPIEMAIDWIRFYEFDDQQAPRAMIPKVAEQWRVLEIPFESASDYSESGADRVIMDVTFSQKGSSLTVPAFWDGGNSFKVRFAPPCTGNWTWRTSCLEDRSLDGLKGRFKCTEYSGNLDIYKHGFVRSEAGTKYLHYADGTPFFYLGDTHWGMYTEEIDEPGPHVGDISTDSHFKYIVHRRAQQGFTVYQSEPIGAPFDLTDGKVDQSDIEGFRTADRYYRTIADEGLVHANAEFFFASAMRPQHTDVQLRTMARYWVARFGAFPVLWTLAQEVDNDFYRERGDQKWYDYSCNPWVDVARYIHEYDVYAHPLSAHQENTWHTTVTGLGAQDDTSAISGHGASAFLSPEVAERTGHNWWAAQWSPSLTEIQRADVVKDYLDSPYPAINYEGRYCGLWTKDFGARAQGWISFLSGFAGYGYGAVDMWLYKSGYDVNTTSNDGVDRITPEDKAAPWSESIEYESARQMRCLRDFFTSFDWWRLKPVQDGSFVPADGTAYAFARTPDTMVLYFYSKDTGTGSLCGLEPGEKHTVSWYNPRTGEKPFAHCQGASTEGVLDLPPRPDDGDWVLMLSK